MTGNTMRANPLFMRNNFLGAGRWGIPTINKQEINLENVRLIACSDTKSEDNEINKKAGVHFFVDDYRFEGIYKNPKRTLERYSQYAFLLSPDFSTYTDMQLWRQIESVAKNRWCGAYWQSKGLTVIPTVSWSTIRSYDFCFDGIEQGSVVAVGMIGCKGKRRDFLRGYNAMIEKIQPSAIICFGAPFPEMQGKIITVDYMASRKVVR